MQSLVGIIRTGSELEEALGALDELEDRARRVTVSGGPRYNPGWNLTTDLPAMLTVSRCTTLGAINRKESRGGHTRDDFPTPVAEMGAVNFVLRTASGGSDGKGVGGTPSIGSITVGPEPIPVMPDELKELLEEAT
jgi:succinate dehydrogenase / fumarate reductase flavoprotein subunit